MPGRLGRKVLDILRLMIEGVGDGEHYRAGDRMDLINITRWTTLARDLATGELAGLPEAEWFDSQPRTICQRNTIVRPDHRVAASGGGSKPPRSSVCSANVPTPPRPAQATQTRTHQCCPSITSSASGHTLPNARGAQTSNPSRIAERAGK